MKPSVLVISVEGLSTALVGCYGSNTAITPAIDQLAAHGIVLDNCFLDSIHLSSMLTSLWTGQHAITRFADSGSAPVSTSLFNAISSNGGHSIVITDCEQTAELAERLSCNDVQLIDVIASEEPVEQVEDCSQFQLFLAALQALHESLSECDGPRLCWIHSRGLRDRWDAPIELRNRFAESEDPDPPSAVDPPAFEILPDTDPDFVTGWAQVAAAQTAVIDQAVAMLREVLAESDEDWSLVFLGLNGYPLGEHQWLGWGNPDLHGEQLQTVTVFCPAPRLPIGWRVDEVVQLPDVAVSIAEMLNVNLAPGWGQSVIHDPNDLDGMQVVSQSQIAVIQTESVIWVRSPAWSLTTYTDCERSELYVKPDDRWEISEVASRCPEVVERMVAIGQQFVVAANAAARDQVPMPEDVLCNLQR